MIEISLTAQLVALALLLVVSAFFSIAETSMMALNRYRLRAMVRLGNRAAARATVLLARTDRLLGVILVGNNLVNSAASVLSGVIAIRLLGQSQVALAVATGAITFLIVVFSEITPKVLGATFPERIALPLAYLLGPLLKALYPVVWFVNLFPTAILRLLGIRPGTAGEPQRLSPEELRSLVLEQSHFIPRKHASILVNLFDLERISVEDVMTPRAQIEAIDLDAPAEDLAHQIATSYHTRLPAYRGELGNVVEGGSSLRELNRKLGLALPVGGPKTLNGLILEHFQDIPEGGVSLKIAGVPMEIVQTQDRVVKTVRLFRPQPVPETVATP